MYLSEFKSGDWVQRFQYKSFEPNLIDLPWQIDNAELNMLLSVADRKLGELNAFSMLIPDIDFFIKMHVLKEGTQSSKIEGTQTNIDEAVQKESSILAEKKDDWHEVQNYVVAMNQAITDLKTLPLSGRLLKATHKALMRGVRGEHKMPGDFRQSQNWIGGRNLSDAFYIPPHFESINNLIYDLEKFLHNEQNFVPDLIKIAIAHYQFETIHPFLDGNGRIGRLLITLYLVDKELLSTPTLYLSEYLENNRQAYYEYLTRARIDNDITRWVKFFLLGVTSTAEKSVRTLKKIIELRYDCESKIIKLGKKRALALELLKYLYGSPIVEAADVAANLSINISTAIRLINDFISLNILIETTGFKRNRLFAFEEYLQLFR